MRPDFSEIHSGAEFLRWYWLKEEMVEICKLSGLPYSGRKFDLRDRIAYALDHDGALLPMPKKRKVKSKFDWANATLNENTVITDNVTFGPNFRAFMKHEIGNKFSCHSDFMDWVRENEGKTLADAVSVWRELERRKEDPEFKRSIAKNNMLAQYVRDFLSANPKLTLKEALACWQRKKQLPTGDGFIRYAAQDLQYI